MSENAMKPRTVFVIGCCCALVGCGRQQPAKSRQESGPVRVRSAPVLVRQMQREVESVGSLFPFEEVIISSEIDGRVVQVTSDLGDRVETNQLLVQVSDEEQRYLLLQNEAQLRQSLERLGLKNEQEIGRASCRERV